MCLSPVEIVNPSRYISLKYRDRYLMQVPCGQCAECQSQKSMEWQFRSYYEFMDCLNDCGDNFIYFDTLTYDETNVPRLRDIIDCPYTDYCFNHRHLTLFFKKLRKKLKGVKLRYFVASEYGSLDFTARPHYHVLFYVYGFPDAVQFSRLIADCWQYGRTDGYPYKPAFYVNSHNVIRNTSKATILRTINYVTKYVQKNCQFQSLLKSRVDKVMYYLAEKVYPRDPQAWLDNPQSSVFRKIVKGAVNQFHRQSLHYGESYLSECDLLALMRDGVVNLPSHTAVKLQLKIPAYYVRKAFYELVEVNGVKCWQPTNLGVKYCELQLQRAEKYLFDRYAAVCHQYGYDYDVAKLAHYVLRCRGRIIADLDSVPLLDKLNDVDYYNYSHFTDKLNNTVGLSTRYLGCSTYGYCGKPNVRIRDFIQNHVYLDGSYESQLSNIAQHIRLMSQCKQDAYALLQRIKSRRKAYTALFLASLP